MCVCLLPDNPLMSYLLKSYLVPFHGDPSPPGVVPPSLEDDEVSVDTG